MSSPLAAVLLLLASPAQAKITQIVITKVTSPAFGVASFGNVGPYEILAALAKVLAEVRRAVEDWRAILGRVTGLIADLKNSPPPLPVDEIAESIQFLEWLMEDNFTFLGVCDYSFSQDGTVFTPNLESSLGILRGREGNLAAGGRIEMPPRARAAFNERRMLIITKTNVTTLPIELSKYQGSTEGRVYGRQAALAVGITVPLMIIGLIIRKHLARGFSFGMVRR